MNEFRNRLNQLRTNNDSANNLFFTLNDVPDLGLKYARLYREVMLQEKILEFLLPQYEQAKIQEAKDTPTVQVLDEAVIPVKRVKPKRAFFVLFCGALSLFVSICTILLIESFNNLQYKSPERYEKIVKMLNAIQQDFHILSRNKS